MRDKEVADYSALIVPCTKLNPTEITMQMNAYLSFKGDCEEAFTTYARVVGARVGKIFRYGNTPMAQNAPADWSDKVMHTTLTVGNQPFMAGDVLPDKYQKPKDFSLSLHIESVTDGEKIFRELAAGGNIVMPFEKTFWS